jgi:hypothetical protein
VLRIIFEHGHPALISVIGLIAAAMAALIFTFVSKRKERAKLASLISYELRTADAAIQ